MKYEVFTRNWWKVNPAWPGGLELHGGARRTHICYASSEQEAREICKRGNDNRPRSWYKLSRKYEYTS